MTVLEVHEVKAMLSTMLNSLGRVESRIATPSQAQLCDLEIGLRKAKRRCLPHSYSGDPAWDILLRLDQAARSNERCYVFNLEIDTETPPTTVLRYLSKLEEDGLIERSASVEDRRRVEVKLTEKGAELLSAIFSDTLDALRRQQRLTVPPPAAMIG